MRAPQATHTHAQPRASSRHADGALCIGRMQRVGVRLGCQWREQALRSKDAVHEAIVRLHGDVFLQQLRRQAHALHARREAVSALHMRVCVCKCVRVRTLRRPERTTVLGGGRLRASRASVKRFRKQSVCRKLVRQQCLRRTSTRVHRTIVAFAVPQPHPTAVERHARHNHSVNFARRCAARLPRRRVIRWWLRHAPNVHRKAFYILRSAQTHHVLRQHRK